MPPAPLGEGAAHVVRGGEAWLLEQIFESWQRPRLAGEVVVIRLLEQIFESRKPNEERSNSVVIRLLEQIFESLVALRRNKASL